MAWGDLNWLNFSSDPTLTVPSGVSGAPDNTFLASPDNWWQQDRGLGANISSFFGSKENQSALGKLGTSLLGAASQANPAYLRIQAGAPPYSPGSNNSLLNSLLQMQLQQKQLQQFPLGQNFRASLLG